MNDNSRSVYGIEISNTRLKSASENSCKNSFFLRADAEQLPFCNNSFDVIVAHSVLHHLPQLDSNGLAEIQRVLTADGSLLFYEPGRFNPPAAIRRSLLPSNIHTPDEQPFDPSQLEAKLLQSFEYVDIHGHILFSSLLPVMQKQVPVDIPHILTRALYNIEKKLLSSVTNRLAWILTGMAKRPKK
jgi:SAM-dependent methyltransferase